MRRRTWMPRRHSWTELNGTMSRRTNWRRPTSCAIPPRSSRRNSARSSTAAHMPRRRGRIVPRQRRVHRRRASSIMTVRRCSPSIAARKPIDGYIVPVPRTARADHQGPGRIAVASLASIADGWRYDKVTGFDDQRDDPIRRRPRLMSKKSDPERITLTFDLHDLPTAQHRAGLAGLILQIDSMGPDGSNGIRERIPDIEELTPTSATITFTRDSMQGVFDDLYAAEHGRDRRVCRSGPGRPNRSRRRRPREEGPQDGKRPSKSVPSSTTSYSPWLPACTGTSSRTLVLGSRSGDR